MNDQAIVNPHDADLPYLPCVPLTLDDFDRAPVRFTYTTELDCTPDALFDVFEDAESWPRWAIGIGRVIWTSPEPYGVGTTRTVVFWGGMQVYETFLDWERGRRMAFTFDGTTERVWTSFGERYTVEDLGGGRCRLTWLVAYTPAGWFGRLHGWIAPVMRFNLGTYMWWLRRYVARL
jgi:hypothetical protein